MAEKYEWKCPKCGATPNKCGKGRCNDRGKINCEGFVCECDYYGDYDDPSHGAYLSTPCPNATCYHCGWYGEFPQADKKPVIIKKITEKLEAQGCKNPEKTAKSIVRYIMNQMRID